MSQIEVQMRDTGTVFLTSEAARQARLRPWPVLITALLLRVFALVLMFRRDPRLWFYNQASELTCLAHSVLSGRGLSSPFGGSTGPSAFLAPGYPLLVSLAYRFFGAYSYGAATALVMLNVLCGVLVVSTVMFVARQLYGVRTAHIAGVLCAIAPTMLWLPALFWETSLSTLFLAGAVALALWCVRHPARSTWIMAGAACAFAMLVNPALAVTFAALGLWAALKAKHAPRSSPWLALLTCAMLFSVWPIRNAVSLHAFVPLRSNLGYELWQGNRPGSQGFFSQDLYLNANRGEYNRYAAMGELPFMREKSRIAVAAIKANPARFFGLCLKRMVIFWTALGGEGISRVVTGEIILTSSLGLAGLILMLKRRVAGTILLAIPWLLFPLPYYITHPDFRFRLLLEPLVIMLSAWLLERCSAALKAQHSLLS